MNPILEMSEEESEWDPRVTDGPGRRKIAVIDMREIIGISRVEDEKFVITLRNGTSLTAPGSGFDSTVETWIEWVKQTK